jgi:uncharacterized protein (DUF1778 family)
MPRRAVKENSRTFPPHQIQLSARDSLRVLELLENPPAPNTRLIAAAGAVILREEANEP